MPSLYKSSIYRAKYSALPLIVFWATALATLGVLERTHWLPRWLLLLFTAPVGLLGIMHLYHAYLRISWGVATFKNHYLNQIRRMLSVFPLLARFRSEVIKIATHLILGIIGISIAIAFAAYSVVAPSIFLLGVALTAALRAALPPAAVYLASSNPERIQLFGRLSAACIPGVFALLEVSTYVNPEDKFSVFYWRAAMALNDCRTRRDEDWTAVARVLIETAPMVIVDGRDNTPGLRLELERILRNKLDFKTYFLSPKHETPTLLASLGAKSSHPSGEFFIVPPDELVAAFPAIVRETKRFWVLARMDA